MTPQEAIGLLDSAVSQMELNRKGHNILSEALNTLVKAVEPKSRKSRKKKPMPKPNTTETEAAISKVADALLSTSVITTES